MLVCDPTCPVCVHTHDTVFLRAAAHSVSTGVSLCLSLETGWGRGRKDARLQHEPAAPMSLRLPKAARGLRAISGLLIVRRRWLRRVLPHLSCAVGCWLCQEKRRVGEREGARLAYVSYGTCTMFLLHKRAALCKPHRRGGAVQDGSGVEKSAQTKGSSCPPPAQPGTVKDGSRRHSPAGGPHAPQDK